MSLNISAAEAGSNKSCSQFLGRQQGRSSNIRALISRIGFWGPLCSKYNEKPPKLVLVMMVQLIKAPTHCFGSNDGRFTVCVIH